MDMSFLLNNPIMQNPIVSGAIGILFAGLGAGNYIANWWRTSKYKKGLDNSEEALGNLSALRFQSTLRNIIKDDAIFNATIEALDSAPDNFNRGWDRGLRGLKIGTDAYNAYIGK